MCQGGVNLEPVRFMCVFGAVQSWISASTVFYVILLVCICYFGWNYIEAVLILLPIPDPLDVKEQFWKYIGKVKDFASSKIGGGGAASSRDLEKANIKNEYTKKFDAAETIGDDSDDNDDVG